MSYFSMENDIQFLSTFEHLAGLVGGRFGGQFVFKSASQLNDDGLGHISSSLMTGSPVRGGDWIFFPILSGTKLIGAACLSKHNEISENDLNYINQIVKLVLETRLNQVEKLELLDAFAAHLEDSTQANTKVIQFKRLQKNLFPLAENDLTPAFNFPFLIESQSQDDIFKMALEIHSRSSRYAIIPLQDLSADVLKSTEALNALGHISIYVANLSDLSTEVQERIAHYYRSTRTQESPQFIVGTTTPLSELKTSPLIASDLVQLLTIGYLAMTRPFADYKRENVLAFFYDSLTGRTSV